jgi:serine kinase of HPr protein (carbohydrate metabolism regulator)
MLILVGLAQVQIGYNQEMSNAESSPIAQRNSPQTSKSMLEYPKFATLLFFLGQEYPQFLHLSPCAEQDKKEKQTHQIKSSNISFIMRNYLIGFCMNASPIVA